MPADIVLNYACNDNKVENKAEKIIVEETHTSNGKPIKSYKLYRKNDSFL